LSAIFLTEWGWRPACLIWAGLNMLLAAPLNCLILPRHGAPPALASAVTELSATQPPRAAMPILAFFSRRHMVRAVSDGGAFAGVAWGGGGVLDSRNRRRGAGQPGPGRRSHRRV
jgi:hypothetical protein